MPRMRALAFGLIAASAVVAVVPAADAARKADPDRLAAKKIQDLHYGDVLFHFYAGDEFESLTRLEAYEHWKRMPMHANDAALLAGGLYLTLGLHNEAGGRFQQLLTGDLPQGVRNRAWFYLAKVWYARGYYDRSEQALDRIEGVLAAELEAERQHLLVNVLMRQERFDEAATRLASWRGPQDWMAYARFNLGVALVRQDRIADADPILTAVGSMSTRSTEMLALKDKANLALGYAWLQANQPEPARIALNRVRLSGPYATRALLGVGWAESALGDYRAALTPWMELHDRNLLDAAVQESYLAVPFAFGKLGANAQAAEYYESAIQSFDAESNRIDDAVARIGAGHMLDDMLGAEQTGKPGWFWQLRSLPDAPQSRYLYAVLADNDFQEGLKNYRDLSYFNGTLERWRDNMEAFGAMIDTRERAYAERMPRADALLATDRPGELLGTRTAVDGLLNAAETAGDVAALGSAEERAQWARIRALEEALASAGSDPDAVAARDKLRLVKGALLWKLDENFKARVYEERVGIREIDAALNEAQNRWARVQRARGSVPLNTGEFAARIAALNQRIASLGQGLRDTGGRQDRFLTQLAQNELLAQKERLAAYEVQARFALADIYDRAVSGNAAEVATPVVPPAGGAATPAGAVGP